MVKIIISMLALKVEKRKILGRKVKKLRKEGILPANVYGKKIKSLAIEVPASDFDKIYKEAGETKVVELLLGSEKRPALIHSVQKDPVTDSRIHVDFLQVDLKEKVTAQVPIELFGESSAEKEGRGIVVQQLDEVEVEALPGDLPDKFEIDLAPLVNKNDTIYVKDIKVDPKKVSIKNEPDQIVVKIEQAKEEEEATAVEAVPEEGAQPSAEGEEEVKDKEKEEAKESKENKDSK